LDYIECPDGTVVDCEYNALELVAVAVNYANGERSTFNRDYGRHVLGSNSGARVGSLLLARYQVKKRSSAFLAGFWFYSFFRLLTSL
jgi:hypothetical protein